MSYANLNVDYEVRDQLQKFGRDAGKGLNQKRLAAYVINAFINSPQALAEINSHRLAQQENRLARLENQVGRALREPLSDTDPTSALMYAPENALDDRFTALENGQRPAEERVAEEPIPLGLGNSNTRQPASPVL